MGLKLRFICDFLLKYHLEFTEILSGVIGSSWYATVDCPLLAKNFQSYFGKTVWLCLSSVSFQLKTSLTVKHFDPFYPKKSRPLNSIIIFAGSLSFQNSDVS